MRTYVYVLSIIFRSGGVSIRNLLVLLSYDRVPTPSSVIVSDRAVRCGLHRVKERYP